MADDAETIVCEWAEAMLAHDVGRVMRLGHPDIRLAMHLGDVPLPFVGVTHGFDAARRRTEQVFESWRFTSGDLRVLSIDGGRVRSQWIVTMTHRWTGFSIDTKARQVFLVEGNLIRSYDAYIDTPRFSAFLRLVGLAPAKSRVPFGD